MIRCTKRYVFSRRLFFLFSIFLCSILFLLIYQNSNFSLSSNINNQVLIIIRTSHYCQSRLEYLYQSWIPKDIFFQTNIYFLTDNLLKYSNKNLLNLFQNFIQTNCRETHNQLDLCCKTSHEFELFYNLSKINSNLQWLCRFDDDQYVNLPNLYQFLSTIDSSKPFYIGRTSSNSPLRISHTQTFRFATYGAGVCFSRPLLSKLQPYVNKTIFSYGCKNRGLSDDGYIGYLIEFILNISLTSIDNLFHSHLENLTISFRIFDMDYIQKSITFGFAWDRYTLSWLPIIHQLIELMNNNQKLAAKKLWNFLQNYEKEHPNDLTNQYDQTCTIYKKPIKSI